MQVFKKPLEFDWNKGNIAKNLKHSVQDREAEESFLDKDKVIYKDALHSKIEERYILIGKTKKKRLLCMVFTMRNKKIRIISARDINKKEVKLYEKAT